MNSHYYARNQLNYDPYMPEENSNHPLYPQHNRESGILARCSTPTMGHCPFFKKDSFFVGQTITINFDEPLENYKIDTNQLNNEKFIKLPPICESRVSFNSSPIDSNGSNLNTPPTNVYEEVAGLQDYSQQPPFKQPKKGRRERNGPTYPRLKVDGLFVCTFPGCKKSFKTSSHFTRHYLIHTGERSQICPIPHCGKAFARLDNMKAHIKTHKKREEVKETKAIPNNQVHDDLPWTVMPPLVPSIISRNHIFP